MADLTMCLTEKCEMRARCWRAQAPVTHEWQSYGEWKPDGSTCRGFWPMPKEESYD